MLSIIFMLSNRDLIECLSLIFLQTALWITRRNRKFFSGISRMYFDWICESVWGDQSDAASLRALSPESSRGLSKVLNTISASTRDLAIAKVNEHCQSPRNKPRMSIAKFHLETAVLCKQQNSRPQNSNLFRVVIFLRAYSQGRGRRQILECQLHSIHQLIAGLSYVRSNTSYLNFDFFSLSSFAFLLHHESPPSLPRLITTDFRLPINQTKDAWPPRTIWNRILELMFRGMSRHNLRNVNYQSSLLLATQFVWLHI